MLSVDQIHTHKEWTNCSSYCSTAPGFQSSTKVLFKEKSVTWCLSNGFSGKNLSYQPNGLKFEQLSIFITSSIVWVFWGDSEVEDPSCPNFANNLQSNLKTLASICNIAWRKELVVRNHTNYAKTSRVSGLTVIPAWMIISIVMHGMKLLIHFQILMVQPLKFGNG